MSYKEKRASNRALQKLSIKPTLEDNYEASPSSGRGHRSAKSYSSNASELFSSNEPTPITTVVSPSITLWTVDETVFQPSSLSTPEGIEVASQLLLDMLRGAQRRAITGSHKAAFAFQDANKTTETNEDADLASVVMNAVLNEATTRFLSTFQSWTLPLLLSYNAELNELFSTTIVNSFPTSANQYLASRLFTKGRRF
ncbi:hypothetical protein FRC18_011188 [Serendipita sp. 400]|nr:hypothetical protein FRC18_011188 [Serendipita sp. 400]